MIPAPAVGAELLVPTPHLHPPLPCEVSLSPCPCWTMAPENAGLLFTWGMGAAQDASVTSPCPHSVSAPREPHVLRIREAHLHLSLVSLAPCPAA